MVADGKGLFAVGTVFAKGPDYTAIAHDAEKTEYVPYDGDEDKGHNPGVPIADDFEAMDADQLLTYAKENDIEVPGNMKKEDTIRRYIQDSTAADE